MTVENQSNQGDLPRSRPKWGSYPAFLLATIGSSIGLGNVWRFPSELGVHGGTFLYLYLISVALVAFPLILAELWIGRVGQGNPVASVRSIAETEHRSGLWQVIGWLGILTSFLIFSFYSVVASWILFYLMSSISGAFVDMPAEIVQNSFGALLRNTDQMLIWHSVFVLLVVLVLSRDVRHGLERSVRFLMPVFIGILVWLALYATEVGDYQTAYDFMFGFDASRINAEMIVSALTQALFSLSIGIGILIMYGSYLSQDKPLFLGAGSIMLFDTGIALLMSVTIFSIVFAFGMQPDSGFGLIFETLPVAFAQMTENGVWWSSAFFCLLLVAALTSGFALLEPTIAFLVDRLSMTRRIAAWLVGAGAWLLGLLSVYSFSELRFSFYYFGTERQDGFFDLLSLLSIHILLPLTALLIALFAGWRMPTISDRDGLKQKPFMSYRVWRLCICYLAPTIIAVVLLLVLFFPG
ncbi:sodium-dependent transporter [Arenicella xantha]|uniref:NSS family neurotransmitter:Na+ symporter n=1 Tax=Arenicella xantha TaxID=644221 RepID=A0A395JF15_9GAMM|nr:sodium-dependent transporter [Arenicella xantha]RBP48315.1 NSS family neurotransmitter:Na+ symporter [Arenicella xantha]